MTTALTISRAESVDWNRELNGAKMLMKSGLLPSSVKSPEAALFIILTGRDLGLSPIQSLRSINVIQGKVEVSADMSLGLFHRAGGKSHFAKLTDTEAVLRFSAPWLIQDHEESFTIKDAERAGLLSRQDNWRKFPKAMLRSRAITAGLKSIGFDPTAGVYDYGEIGGEQSPLTPEGVPVSQAEVTTLTDATQEVGSNPADSSEDSQEDKAALAEIESLLPEIAENQQAWVVEKLRDGAEPLPLLAAIKEKIAKAGAAQ